jgi:hypothetical protein
MFILNISSAILSKLQYVYVLLLCKFSAVWVGDMNLICSDFLRKWVKLFGRLLYEYFMKLQLFRSGRETTAATYINHA